MDVTLHMALLSTVNAMNLHRNQQQPGFFASESHWPDGTPKRFRGKVGATCHQLAVVEFEFERFEIVSTQL